MIKRKINEDKGLQGVFYIVDMSKGTRPEDQWWQLRLVESHYVFSAVGSKERVLGCLKKACIKYKTYHKLMRALRGCEHKISNETKNKLQKEYLSIGRIYEEEVQEVVSSVESNRKELPRKKSLFSKVHTSPEVVEKPVEEAPKEMVVRKPIPKKKKLGLIK